jgi:predicted site-specific integrase-resolvase
MKSKEALKILNVTRQTLYNYVKSGKIKVTKLGNGYYNYDDDSIYLFLNAIKERTNVIYARVSTYKQKNDLANQVFELVTFCNNNNIKYNNILQEIASGIDFDRKQFSILIDDVINKKINNIYITHKDRLSRLSFMTLENMFKQFGTNIVVINNNNDNNKELEDDLFEELINIIHVFSTRIYSSRRKKNLDNVMQKIKIL